MKVRSLFLTAVITLGFGYLILLKYYTPTSSLIDMKQGEKLLIHTPPQILPDIPIITKDQRPKDWYDKLLLELENQNLLRENILSKEFVWRNLSFPDDVYFPQRHALLYLGWVAFWNMEEYAKMGGPAGEFVIWGDFITALAALGYQLTIVKRFLDLWIYLKANPEKYDIIITDYDGLGTAENIGHFPRYHCRYYLIDGFGTQQQFNKRNLDLKRILTPYPFDGSNSPIHIISSVLPSYLRSLPREQGVLWSKDPSFLLPHLETIRYIAEKLNITLITTFRTNIADKVTVDALQQIRSIPNIKFFNFLDRFEYLKLLSGSMFLIGFGRPLDGPTPFEAIAHGCAFINPLFLIPFVHNNKPTRYAYHSQHPFVQDNVPEPYAYTIDITNHTLLSNVIANIIHRFRQRVDYESNQKDASQFYYRHPSHIPSNYVMNIHEILSNTSESKCLAKYSKEGISPPSKHPGNNVYETFSDFIRDNCQGFCQPHWVDLESSKSLFYKTLNKTQQLTVLRSNSK